MSTEVKMSRIPNCDLDRNHGPAFADAKLSSGPWAYVCSTCFGEYGCSLGTGKGQRLVLAK